MTCHAIHRNAFASSLAAGAVGSNSASTDLCGGRRATVVPTATLDAVVEHYNSGVQAGPALDVRMLGPGGAPPQLNLSAADKAALVAFMQTLTDTVLTTDPKFSDPFKK